MYPTTRGFQLVYPSSRYGFFLTGFDILFTLQNHVGLVHALMLALAKSGRLKNQVEIAKKKMTQRQAKGQGAMELDMD